MKCYRLKKATQNDIIYFIRVMAFVTIIVILSIGFVEFPLILILAGISEEDLTPSWFSYIGIISWTIFLSFLAISSKRWLQDNIEEC